MTVRSHSDPPPKPGFDDLAGRRVVVTGGSSGIGAAVALAFGTCGARVGVHYHRGEAAARAVADSIVAAGGSAVCLKADFGDPASYAPFATGALERLGGVDVLINNAGGVLNRRAFAETDEELYSRVFNLNVRTAVGLTRAFLPALRAAGDGVVINTSSLAARTGGGPGTVLYAATKGAINSLTIGLAKELGPDGIRVNTVSPGVILTPLHDSTHVDVLERVRLQVPLRRLGTVEDCVGAFLFLASTRLAGYINGANIEVGGGRV